MSDIEEGHHPCHEVEPGVHHRRRVDEGGDRCRPLHRVRQPDVERELSALSNSTDEEHEHRTLHRSCTDDCTTDSGRRVIEDDREVE